MMDVKDYQSTCIDYLNGHMSILGAQNFESELQNNQALAEELNETKQWQSYVQRKQQTDIIPNFDGIKSKLTKSQSNWGWAYSLTAATSLMFLVYLGVGEEQNVVNNKFETLTSPTNHYTKPVIQIVLSKNVNIDQFIADYDLMVIENISHSQIIVVEHSAKLEDDFLTLTADKRTVFVKKLDESK